MKLRIIITGLTGKNKQKKNIQPKASRRCLDLNLELCIENNNLLMIPKRFIE